MSFLARLALLALAVAVLEYGKVVEALNNQASFAVNIQNRTGTGDPYEFDAILVNRGDALNQDTWNFLAPSDGLYLVFLTAGYPGNGQDTDYRVAQNGTVMASIRRTQVTGGALHTLGLDVVSWLYADTLLSIRSTGNMLASTPTGFLTSWGIFSLSTDLGSQFGFGVASRAPHSTGKIPFGTVLANLGNAWDTSSNSFTAPVSGVYFFSMSTGAQRGNEIHLKLSVNGQTLLGLRAYGTTTSTVDSQGRAVLVHLTEGERVELRSETTGYSDDSYLTTFSGFLYNNSQSKILAWSAYRNHGISGSTDVLDFHTVSVNAGGAFYNNRVHCLFTGHYYIHVSAYMNSATVLRVIIENRAVAELIRGYRSGPPYTLSRSLIVTCNAGETIRCGFDGAVYGQSDTLSTSFMGFY